MVPHRTESSVSAHVSGVFLEERGLLRAALEAEAELVRRVLVTPDLSARGVYACRLCRAGEWRVVYVDELLPVRRDGRAAFCQVATALWPALVEKARPRRLMSRRWRTATLQPLANAGVRKDFWVL